MNYFLITYGCQMNKSDSERLERILANLGYKTTSTEEKADLLLINACSVRESAIQRLYGRLNKWQELKNKRPEIKTILTGCVLEADKKKLAWRFDLVFDIRDLTKLPQMLGELNKKCVQGEDINSYFKIKPKLASKISVFIPIMTGCNNFCAYCAVPYTRGREISRPFQDIIEEIRGLIAEGYQDFTLLGQNVNSYRNGQIDFVSLLKEICCLRGQFYLKFYSNHPKDFSEKLIGLIAKEEKIVKYVHLPLQAGDNGILHKMNRKYTREEYLELVKKIRDKIPDVVITTDAIVGFPGESKEQFQNTVRIFKEVNYDMGFIALFSPRPGTAASRLKDNIPYLEKRRREKVLTKILKDSALENNKKFMGKKIKAVVEKRIKNNLWQGEALTLKSIRFKSEIDLRNRIIDLKIIKANPWSLEGELS